MMRAAAASARAPSARARDGLGGPRRAAVRAVAQPPKQRPPADRTVQAATKPYGGAQIEDYGKYVFRGAVADSYLEPFGLTSEDLSSLDWTFDEDKAELVATAMRDWAVDCGATSYAHWFQPMGAGGVRHGQAACVQTSMLSFGADGRPSYEFSADDLLTGETDGSSYPNGGMRATHTAGGYLAVDPLSPPFVLGDVMFIPAAFIAYTGQALDEKTPLHRSAEALSDQGTRLLNLLGVECTGIVANIGLEQEIFLVPRDAYYTRPDLQFVGRTLIGKAPARGQEMSDHYMAPLTSATAALACMQAIQEECFKLGIPLKTRHREVAPNQYEFAPLFGDCRVQTDQNLLVMQIIEETAAKYNLAALLHEKPFAGVNGSGKHNNWSFATVEGLQLLNPKQVLKTTGNPDLFPAIMAAVVRGVDLYGDLLRLSIASPGNDFRLGAMEAPPAVMSTYLGSSLTEYLESYVAGEDVEGYSPTKMRLPFGVKSLRPMDIPSEDRNRTSPLPYGGNRFEFRAAGSSQNVSMINTVLNTITAEGMKVIADRVEAGEDLKAVTQDLLKTHMKCVFNGDGYDPAWPDKAVELGIFRIDSGVDAVAELTADKNIKLFGEMGVLNEEECEARKNVMFDHYVGIVEMEVLCLKDMIQQHILPSCEASDSCDVETLQRLQKAATTLVEKAVEVEEAASPEEAAKLAHTLRFGTMEHVRALCDETEASCKADLWTMATYKDLLFLDTHTHLREELAFGAATSDSNSPGFGGF